MFRRQAVLRFEDRMVAHVATNYPQLAALGEPRVRQLIQHAIATGAKHNIRSEGPVAVLFDVMLQVGEQFERTPLQAWIRELLAHPTLPERLKVDLISQRVNAATQGRVVVPVESGAHAGL